MIERSVNFTTVKELERILSSRFDKKVSKLLEALESYYDFDSGGTLIEILRGETPDVALISYWLNGEEESLELILEIIRLMVEEGSFEHGFYYVRG